MNRLAMISASALLVSVAFALQACGSSDDSSSNTNGGSGNPTSGGTTSTAGTGTSSGGTVANGGTSSGGTSNVAGSTSGGSAGATTGGSSTGGSSAAGTSSTAGSSTGGSSAAGTSSTAGTGGSGTAGTGGGSAGTGGGTAPAACMNGEASKGACTTEGSVCAKSCGISALTPTKTETCTAGAYVEGACTYPAGADYTCYKLPAQLMACPGADVAGPVSGSACTAATCMPCGPAYQDSKMTAKTGACVCGDNGKWQCASSKEWPPQM